MARDWNVVDGSLQVTASDDTALAELFEFALATELLAVHNATTEGTKITGTADVWGDLHTEIEIETDATTTELVTLLLRKPIDGVEGLEVGAVTFDDLEMELLVTAEVEGTKRVGHLAHTIHGKIGLGHLSLDITIRIVGQRAVIEVDPSSGDHPSTLADLAALLGGTGAGDLAALPSPLDAVEGLELRSVQFWIDPREDTKIARVTAALGYPAGTEWVLFDGFPALKLGDPHIELDVEHPLEAPYRFATVHLGGSIVIDGKHLDLEARWPTYDISGRLREGETIPLGGFLDELHLPALSGTELVIDSMRFGAAPLGPTPSFDIDLTIGAAWPILPELVLDGLTFSLAYRGNLEGRGSARMTIAGVDVELSADHDTALDGWRFAGRAAEHDGILIGHLLTELGTAFGVPNVVPHAIDGLELTELEVDFDTSSHDFRFSGDLTGFSLDRSATSAANPVETTLSLEINLTHEGNQQYSRSFSGQLHVGDLRFELDFEQESHDGATSSTLAATFSSEAGYTLDLGELIRTAVSPDLAVPSGLDITVNSAMAIFRKQTPATEAPTPPPATGNAGADADTEDEAAARSGFVFGFDMGNGINLSGLPLVGPAFSSGPSVSIAYRLLVARGWDADRTVVEVAFDKATVGELNELLPDGVPDLPSDDDLKSGFDLATTLQFGTETFHLPVPLDPPDQGSVDHVRTGATSSGATSALPVKPTGDPPADVRWFPIQKSIGPMQFRSIGVEYHDSKLTFLLNASLTVGPLTFSLDGLGASSPLDRLEPTFELHGLGLDYRSGPAEIGGSFLSKAANEFEGTATIRTASFSLAAIGSYREVAGHPSLFVYAVLDDPIGGPSFFFVTGLAAGFGYNRTLIIPKIDAVKNFPLVTAATGGKTTDDPGAALEALGASVPPSLGEYFLAVGVKFNSFKMIDSFALLVAQFKEHFELDVLGLSTAVIPVPEEGSASEPLAVIEVALRARFVPDEGTLAVDALVTSASYVFSKNCHLTGGLAFYSWFSGEHAGDFVASVGGYHPGFAVPDWYPAVPRLGFKWLVSDELSVDGDMYFALTPQALMAGGHLAAAWHHGALQAWFSISADFLIAWKPYHYQADVHVHIGGSYTFWFFGTRHVSVDIGADLEIWGPPFAGRAAIHIAGIPLSVEFGSQTRPAPAALLWDTFKTSFLPAAEAVCSASVTAGLVRQDDAPGGSRWIVSPAELRIAIATTIPAVDIHWGTMAEPGDAVHSGPKVGVGPMNLAVGSVSSALYVSVKRDGSNDDEFEMRPIVRSAPTALWGGSLEPAVNAPAFIENTLAGVELVPATTPAPGATHPLALSDLGEPPPADHRLLPSMGSPLGFDGAEMERSALADAVLGAREKRSVLFEAFGLDPTMVTLGGIAGGDLLGSPQIGTFA